MVNGIVKKWAVLLVCATAGFAFEGQLGGIDIAGISKITAIDSNLTGSGVSIGLVCRSNTYTDSFPQNDYRPDVSHNCFRGSKINFHNDQFGDVGISNHSTQIASILVGSDPNAYYAQYGDFSYRAAVPNAELNVYEFWYFITENVYAGQLPKDDLLTMSLGTSSEAWWTRGIDEMVERFGFLIVAAIGNGSDAYDLPLYPAAGANILAVGVVDSNNSLTEFYAPDANHSTAGPTLDSRCKPDIVSPGNCLVAISDKNEPYKQSGDYSSFAAPVVTGVAAVLIQKAKSDPNLQIAASGFSGNCVLKSILMTSATKLTGWHKGNDSNSDDSEYPLDFKQGAGMVDGLSAYELLIAGLQREGDINTAGWDLNMIESDAAAQKVYSFQTGEQAGKFTATVVWNRSYEDKYPFNLNMDLWNDFQLSLRKINKNGEAEVVDYSDSPVDNVEHIYFSLEPNTTYELVVSNSPNYKSKGTTTYALSWQTKD
ncbi:MAG: hypothetical protein A2Y12_11700 [Planctomycetes bacterium GWF2_42_9]|nr:MAG: hypothetical protein A2Y12_11700 [Planctomycetes bacterium GWF2_42_9]